MCGVQSEGWIGWTLLRLLPHKIMIPCARGLGGDQTIVALESSGAGWEVCQVSVITVMSIESALIAFIIICHL